jgi:hypothetical protein
VPVVEGDEFVVPVGLLLVAPLFCARSPLPDEVDAALPVVPQGLLIPAWPLLPIPFGVPEGLTVLGFDGEALGFDEPLMLELPLRPPLPAAPPDVPPLAPDCANTAPLLPTISAAAKIARVFRVVILCSLGSPPRITSPVD